MTSLEEFARQFEEEMSKMGNKPKSRPEPTRAQKVGEMLGYVFLTALMLSGASLAVAGTVWLILHMF